MEKRAYPIGIQTFDRIRRENLFYIDKTEYIYNLTHTHGKYFFLARPRRFGKSLLASTIQCYFEGKKELFEGLTIEKLEKDWECFPVLRFDMSLGKHMQREQLVGYLGNRLAEQEKRFGITASIKSVNDRFVNLIQSIYEKTGKQVVILIDEYDAPLLDVAHKAGLLEMLRDEMRNFYSPLKGCEEYIRFVFMTGITKFSQLSIFSELNNITNISMYPEFAAICGISKEELLTQMSDDIDMLAEKCRLPRRQVIEKLQSHYDGYHFAWPSPDMFNPFSLLNCFATGRFEPYWFGTGTPTYLVEKIREFETLPSELTEMEAEASEFDEPTDSLESILPLLYQAGYITIKDYDEEFRFYTLRVPNKEVEVGLFKALIPYYVSKNTLATTNNVRRMAQCLAKDDMDGALRLLQAFLGTVPYCNQANSEGHYQQMLYVIFTLLTDFLVDVEVHTPHGRVDIVLLSKTRLYIIELKLNQDAATALQQIDLKNYRQRFALSGKPITKVGINFDSALGNMTEWKIS